MQHKLSNGKVIKVSHAEIYGLFDGQRMLLDRRGKPKQKLDAAIHELLHAECPQWPEQKVREIATSTATLLWNLGYRVKKVRRSGA